MGEEPLYADFPMDTVRHAIDGKAKVVILTRIDMLRLLDWGEQLKLKVNDTVRENWRFRKALEGIARETGTPYGREAQAALDGK